MREIKRIKADITQCVARGDLEQFYNFKRELQIALTKGIPTDRLEEICQAENEGRCVVLPKGLDSKTYAGLQESIAEMLEPILIRAGLKEAEE